eukprot:EG_transcript_52235
MLTLVPLDPWVTATNSRCLDTTDIGGPTHHNLLLIKLAPLLLFKGFYASSKVPLPLFIYGTRYISNPETDEFDHAPTTPGPPVVIRTRAQYTSAPWLLKLTTQT